MDYNQPEFYHFSEESIRLAKLVKMPAQNEIKILDMCAGCGVIGIETAKRVQNESPNSAIELTFCDVQKEFRESLTINSAGINSRIFIDDLFNLKHQNYYDIIVCNPPYFDKASFRSSVDPLRDLCRRSERTIHEILLCAFEYLAPRGTFYGVLRESKANQMNPLRQFPIPYQTIEKSQQRGGNELLFISFTK